MNSIFRLINKNVYSFSFLAAGCYTKNLLIARKIALRDSGCSLPPSPQGCNHRLMTFGLGFEGQQFFGLGALMFRA